MLIDAAKEGARIDAQVAQADQKADIDAAKTLLDLAKTEKLTGDSYWLKLFLRCCTIRLQ